MKCYLGVLDFTEEFYSVWTVRCVADGSHRGFKTVETDVHTLDALEHDISQALDAAIQSTEF